MRQTVIMRRSTRALSIALAAGTSAPGALAVAVASPARAHTARTIKGSSAHMRWGNVRVTITVKGKRLTNVAASVPLSKPRSRSINNRATPILRREALKAQSANINAVSGATLTSRAYSQSLQAALRHAGI